MEGQKKAGYEYLLVYKLTVAIYDLTVQFTECFIDRYSRTRDQMVQAARSGMQNIVEGNRQQGLKGYIKLSGVARGSLEELLKDYFSFVRQKKLEIFSKERVLGEIREIKEVWKILNTSKTLPDTPNFPNIPKDQKKAVNLMITLIKQANYLLDKLIASLKEKHMKEGGLSEELYRKRTEYRKNNHE